MHTALRKPAAVFCLSPLAVLLAAALMANVAPADDPANLRLTSRPGRLVGSLPDGEVLWEVKTAGDVEPVWERDGDVILLDGRHVIDMFGELSADLRDSPARRYAAGGEPGDCHYWSELGEVTPEPGETYRFDVPAYDSTGSAWVSMMHVLSGDHDLSVCKSIGHTGAWGPLEVVSDTTNYVWQPEVSIDSNDNVAIVFRDIGGGYKLKAIRHSPKTGWGPLLQPYSTANFFQALEVAGDADGNVVVLFDPRIDFKEAVWSQVYEASSDTWLPPTQISPVGRDTAMITIGQDRSGDMLHAVYMVRDGEAPGLYAHHFDSATKTWSAPTFVPDTSDVGFQIGTHTSRFPMAVDGNGEATVFWQTKYPGPYGVYASRTQGGVWQPAHVLMAPGPDEADFVNFGDADANAQGDAFGVISRYESGDNRLYTFRYLADGGWQLPDNPHTNVLTSSTRVRVSLFHSGRAVATVVGWQNDIRQLTSVLYAGGAWRPDLMDLPQDHDTYYQEFAWDQGEALLIYRARLVGAELGTKATWIRAQPGDIDCDGDVDATDLAILLGSWGPCPPPPAECPGDFNGDGVVDATDLATLLGLWT